jgi:hypothetical protein
MYSLYITLYYICWTLQTYNAVLHEKWTSHNGSYTKKTLKVDVQFIHNFILYLVDTSDIQCSCTRKVDM